MSDSASSAQNMYSDVADLASLPKHRFFRNNKLVEKCRKSVFFDNIIVCGLDIPSFDYTTFRSVDSDVPPAFLYTYFEEGLFQDDPMVADVAASESVLVEDAIYGVRPPPERLSYVLRSHHIFNRTIFPLRRGSRTYGAVEFTRENPFAVDEIEYLRMISEPLHSLFTKPIMERFGAESLKLTPAEVDCLQLASRGLTTEEISAETGYQRNTINTYFQLSAKKLNATNRSQAIAEALRRRLID